MTSFQDSIERTRQYLMTGQQDRINQLHTTIDSDDTTLTIRHELKSFAENARISIGLEEMHVLSVSSTAALSSITVIRGYSGSTAVAHTAGDLVRVNPQFSDYRIGQEINEEFQDLSNPNIGLFRVVPVEFAYNPTQLGYNITASNLIDIWRVRYQIPGSSKEWPVLRRDEWYLDQNANTTDFPGGKQLVLREGGVPGHLIRVSYKSAFGGPLTSTTDDVLAVTGLHTEAHDIPSMGAALRLLMGRDVKRSFMESQPEPRRSQEVGSTAGTGAMRGLAVKYDERIQSELSRLHQRYPDQI